LRNSSWFQAVKNIFSAIGLVVTVLVVALFFTNATSFGTLFSTIYLIKNDSLYVDRFHRQEAFQGAVAGVVDTLSDPYSEYLNHGQWKTILSRLNAEMGGIGVYLLQENDGSLRVVEAIAGGPAERAGILADDVLRAVNHASIVGQTEEYVLSLVRGDPGTPVTVTVYRSADGAEHDFDLTREIISVPSVQSEIMEYQDHKIGYIYLNQFHSRSALEVTEALDKFDDAGISGLIFDVRNNGGGDFEAALEIADMFLETGVMVNIVDSRGNKEERRASPGSSSVPLVMLVNGNSASASEVLSGALQDNERAFLLGERTFGKGLIQTIYPLLDGGALKITTRKYLTPNEIDINEVGIVPDEEISSSAEPNQDVQLQRALEILANKP
jgi:carboxyl-terminal processing protease